MNGYNRKKAEREFNKYYVRLKSDHCIYCGDAKEHRDHIPALRVSWSIGIDYIKRENIKLLLVDSCRNCNQVLTTKGMNIKDKFNILILTNENYLKYAEDKKIKSGWTLEELSELDYSLLTAVLSYNENNENKKLKIEIENKIIKLKENKKNIDNMIKEELYMISIKI